MRNPLIIIILSLSVLLAPMGSAPPAQAAGAMGAVLTGAGSVSPGLTAEPNTHSWGASLGGPAVGLVGTNPPGDLSCSLGWGTVQKEQLGAGAGLGSYFCYPGVSGSWSGTVAVARTGAVVSLTFVGSLVGTVACLLVPAQIPPNPVIQYRLICGAGAVDATV